MMAESPDALGPITEKELRWLETAPGCVTSGFVNTVVAIKLAALVPRLVAALRTAQQELHELRDEYDLFTAGKASQPVDAAMQEARDIRAMELASIGQVLLRKKNRELTDQLTTAQQERDEAKSYATALQNQLAAVQQAKREAQRQRDEIQKAVDKLLSPMSDAEYHARAPGGWMAEALELEAQLTAALAAKDEAERQLKALREAAREVVDAPGIISTDERIDEMKALLLSDPTPTQEMTK